MEEIYKEGLCRAIGVSNFLERHLEDILEVCTIVPMINQVITVPRFAARNPSQSCCRDFMKAGILKISKKIHKVKKNWKKYKR